MAKFQTTKELPRIWLMSDERMDDRLLASVQSLPFGSAIIFRHYSLPEKERRLLFRKVRRAAKRRGHLLLLADSEAKARKWHADGFHLRSDRRRASGKMIHSVAVHNLQEIDIANKAGADCCLLSPLYPTRSHPDAPTLGVAVFQQLARRCESKVIALGGVTAARGRMMMQKNAHGWAAISALQK